ncbi:hypothetical protein BTUL_0057g00260 [Botrytis tulipae]|uniref:Uncharacterized protein n=1 Tax=Botrytis tulipae TaxID=87230 RepID=A0A4Z1ERS8_9HELO|nr:hypothetical protein BTUL_0057g00260 [Botrytis tulipae]
MTPTKKEYTIETLLSFESSPSGSSTAAKSIESEMSFSPTFNQFSMDPTDVNEGFAVPLPAPRVKFTSLSDWRGANPFTNSGSKLEQT